MTLRSSDLQSDLWTGQHSQFLRCCHGSHHSFSTNYCQDTHKYIYCYPIQPSDPHPFTPKLSLPPYRCLSVFFLWTQHKQYTWKSNSEESWIFGGSICIYGGGVSAANWNISGGEEHLWRNSTIAHCSLETPLTWWKNIEMKKWWSLAPKVEAARQQRTAGRVLGGGEDERQLDANCVHKDVHCVPDKSFHLQHLKKMHVWCSRDNVIDVFFGVLTGEECQLTCQFHGWARLQPMSDSSCCASSFKKAFARSKTTRPSVNYAKDWLDSNEMYPVYLSRVYLSCQESWVYLSELIT